MDSVTAFHLIVQEAPFVLSVLVLLFIIGISAYRSVAYIAIACFLVLLFLFRNPARIEKALHGASQALVAPADGKIIAIESNQAIQQAGYCYKISIITSPLNVYINRAPFGGIITRIDTRSPQTMVGSYSADIEVQCSTHRRYKMRRVSGSFLNKIVCWATVGDRLGTGQIYGMVACGSRCELFLPKKVRIVVGIGQHVRAGLTTIGYWNGN